MSKFYRNNKGFFRALTKGSGLYLLLGATGLVVLCIAALLFAPQEGEKAVSAPSDTQAAVSQTASDKVLPGSDPVDSPEDTSPATDNAANATVQDPEPVAQVTMIQPVSGSVETGFSLTVPVFSETMNDWRVHQGIDYKTDGETQVVAAADGIVEGIYTSELMGLTVEIRHEDGTISLYQSLSGEIPVMEGQEVRQGDPVGMTGTSADSECLMGNHLHFAIIRDGIYLDPNDRFAS